ncbi:MAG TPA: uracil-DNA glycosylase [Anaerolineae bacterium]|nr:uracil-DNA glycosylase [Anaerolineae bacterium]
MLIRIPQALSGMLKMIDCHKCEHYYVTWDKNFPHGCLAMDFKSLQAPSVVVQRSTQGKDCILFKQKIKKRQVRDEQGKSP